MTVTSKVLWTAVGATSLSALFTLATGVPQDASFVLETGKNLAQGGGAVIAGTGKILGWLGGAAVGLG